MIVLFKWFSKMVYYSFLTFVASALFYILFKFIAYNFHLWYNLFKIIFNFLNNLV